MHQVLTGHPVVDAIGQLNLEGNLIPHNWYRHIKYTNKRGTYTDHLACLILADIVYWYRPVAVRDEGTGEVIGWRKKFAEDKLQRSPDALAELLGTSAKQARAAIALLEKLRLIDIELRSVHTAFGVIPTTMFIGLNAKAIAHISHCPRKAESLEKSFLTNLVKRHDEFRKKASRSEEQGLPNSGTSFTEMGNSSLYGYFSEITQETSFSQDREREENQKPEEIGTYPQSLATAQDKPEEASDEHKNLGDHPKNAADFNLENNCPDSPNGDFAEYGAFRACHPEGLVGDGTQRVANEVGNALPTGQSATITKPSSPPTPKLDPRLGIGTQSARSRQVQRSQAIATPVYKFSGPWQTDEDFQEFQRQLYEHAKLKGKFDPSAWVAKVVDGISKGIRSSLWDDFQAKRPLGSAQYGSVKPIKG